MHLKLSTHLPVPNALASVNYGSGFTYITFISTMLHEDD
jgi:hypothetical protein